MGARLVQHRLLGLSRAGSNWGLIRLGLTVGTLIGAAVLTGAISSDEKVIQAKPDHSWLDILGTFAFSRRQKSTDQVEQEGDDQLSKADRKILRDLANKNRAAEA